MILKRQTQFKTVGRCPVCNGEVIRTGKGWACINALHAPSRCVFTIPYRICNRAFSVDEVGMLLQGEALLLDGFANGEMTMFSSVVCIHSGKLQFNAQVAECPSCGGTILVGVHAYNCSNFKRAENPCAFSIWRNICGHDVSVDEVRDLCAHGVTSDEVEMYAKDGTPFKRRLGLAPNKPSVIKL